MGAESRIEGHIGPRGDTRCDDGENFERGRITRRIAELGRRDHDVLTTAELGLCGLSSSGIQKRVQAGELHRRYPGVYAIGRSDLTPDGHRIAAVKACLPDACLSFASAAALHRIRQSDASVADVTIPGGRPLRCLRGIRCHRAALLAQDVTSVRGIPVTSVARTLLDLAAKYGEGTVERAANEAVIHEAFDLRAIEELIDRSKGHRGIRRLRRVLATGDLSGESATGLERRFAELCVSHGLPRPELNRWIFLGGEYHQVDCYWREQRVVIEVDSNRYHQTGWKLSRDAQRDSLLTDARFAHDRVDEDLIVLSPAAAVERARRLLATALSVA